MSYTRQNFLSGQVVTEDNLNHMENGIIAATPVKNLLDNGDFTNPVNQRGESIYSANGAYTIDRWMMATSDGSGMVAVGDGYIGLNDNSGYVDIMQIFENATKMTGKPCTFAVMRNGATAPDILNFTFGTDASMGFSDGYGGLIHFNGDRVYIRATNTGDSWVGFLWAAVYEGTYTANTLPKYIPKGYAAEYLECCRYYYKIPTDSLVAHVGYFGSSTIARITIHTPMPMRITPSVAVNTLSNVVVFSGTNSFTPTAVSVGNRSSNTVALVFTVSGATSWTTCSARFNTNASFSADL